MRCDEEEAISVPDRCMDGEIAGQIAGEPAS